MTMAITRFTHACDASAAVLLAGTRLFAAASDEDCVLRVYDLDRPGTPVTSLDVTDFLEPDDPDETEADIEGAAQLGDLIFWLGSHGRSRKGKERKIRQRLFATRLDLREGRPVLTPTGVPYKGLLDDLVTADDLAAFDLATAAGKAPEAEGGLNLEGLAATAEGHLLVGFRNPIPNGRALIVRIANPLALVTDQATRAAVSLEGLLDLGGRGVRALECVPSRGIYLVLAGAFDDGRNFEIYEWSGTAGGAARPLSVSIGTLNPEELLALDHGTGLALHLFSDDGTDACKEIELAAKRFRALATELDL